MKTEIGAHRPKGKWIGLKGVLFCLLYGLEGLV